MIWDSEKENPCSNKTLKNIARDHEVSLFVYDTNVNLLLKGIQNYRD